MISCQAYIDFCENQRGLQLINLRVTRGKSCAIYLTLWTKLWLPIAIHIQHGSTWVCLNITNSCATITVHTSVFSGSSEISKYLYYSTDNYCVSTWWKIRVACYHILVPMPHAHSVTVPNQTWEIGRVSMITRRYVGKREDKNHYGIWKAADFIMFR